MVEPEVTLDSEWVYQGRRISVRRERVRLADGSETIRDIVDHPHSVVIVAVDDDHHVLLVRQYRKALEQALLEAPAGAIEPHEEPVECAQRELREEAGVAAANLTLVGRFWTAPGMLTELMYAYLATGLTEDALPADEDERIAVERVPFAEAVSAARAGALEDAKTIAALLMAERHVLG